MMNLSQQNFVQQTAGWGDQLLKRIRSQGRLDVSTQQAINPPVKNNRSGFYMNAFPSDGFPLCDLIPGTAGSSKSVMFCIEAHCSHPRKKHCSILHYIMKQSCYNT